MGRRHRHKRKEAKELIEEIPTLMGATAVNFVPSREKPEKPRVALGAPVAERAWILPQWWECLSKQTLQPDEFCFIYSPSLDETKHLLSWPGMGKSKVFQTRLPYHSRDKRNADPNDPWRAAHMAQLRNQLKTLFMSTKANIFVSLDTDILLEDPTVLEQIVMPLWDQESEWDVIAPLTYLHPLGAHSQCYNAGFWGGGEGHTQVWRRADSYDMRNPRSPMVIDIPMAAYAIRRHTMGMCSYRSHECGEDIGFAQSLRDHKFVVGWRKDLEVRHVWSQQHLEEMRHA